MHAKERIKSYKIPMQELDEYGKNSINDGKRIVIRWLMTRKSKAYKQKGQTCY
uniref:Uncharacterized protein n=1 Tax=Nelumbo nucifera TaxID=4432 RepID=A0A822Z8C0_NELNU|nr:TPA_asm: hypothetical protein HUJ06_015420 [Nelumbo nucifera]